MQPSNIHFRTTPAASMPTRARLRFAVMALCLLTGAATAGNPPELAAEQLAIDRTSNTGVGDGMNQEFVQMFQEP